MGTLCIDRRHQTQKSLELTERCDATVKSSRGQRLIHGRCGASVSALSIRFGVVGAVRAAGAFQTPLWCVDTCRLRGSCREPTDLLTSRTFDCRRQASFGRHTLVIITPA
jgi:hypothetical protein